MNTTTPPAQPPSPVNHLTISANSNGWTVRVNLNQTACVKHLDGAYMVDGSADYVFNHLEELQHAVGVLLKHGVYPAPAAPLKPAAEDSGWIYLKKGERIQLGDEWLDETREGASWEPARRIGETVNGLGAIYRRKRGTLSPAAPLKPAAEDSGWVYLKEGDIIQPGDEYKSGRETDQVWAPANRIGLRVGEKARGVYRRKSPVYANPVEALKSRE